VTLVRLKTIADFTESVEEYRSAKRILLLTLVESHVAASSQFGCTRRSRDGEPLMRRRGGFCELPFMMI
jgi:hypothetical protein